MCRHIPIVWQSSLPFIGKVLTLIFWTMMISVALLAILILFPCAFIVLFLFPVFRWISILITNDFNTGDMKVPTFYASVPSENEEYEPAMFLLMSVTGVVFGGIHCAGWFFDFPSTDETILWRVCSVILTGNALFLPPLLLFIGITSGGFQLLFGVAAILGFIAYVLSRLLLLVESFISLRHLTPGMLASVKWTTFIPHI